MQAVNDRGQGKRSSFYSDYTFGVWREDAAGHRALIPVGKAYFGFTDAELKQLDTFVREHTTEFRPRPGGARRLGLAIRFPPLSVRNGTKEPG